MYLDYWAIGVMFLLWAVSCIHVSYSTYKSGVKVGAAGTIQLLSEGGFIHIDKNGNISASKE